MIILILIIAFVLRIINQVCCYAINLNQSLWWDEAINVVYSQKFSFWEFVTVYPVGDFHPPLYFGILWIWSRVFGLSEISVRSPSVVFGVLTVYLTYLIGKDLFGKKVGFIAAAILAFNPLHVYYSQEARMYSLAALSVSFSFWALINLLKGRKIFAIIYGFSVALVLYSDYLAYFALAAQLIYIIWQEKKKLAQVLTGMVLGGIIWSPWLLIFPNQLKTGQSTAIQIPGWAGVVGGANIKDLVLVWVKSILGKVSFDNKFIYSGVVLFVSIIYGSLIFKAIKPLSKEVKLLLCWFILPVILAFLVSFYIPVLSYFRTIFILPALCILLGLGISGFQHTTQKFVLGLVLVVGAIFLSMYYLNPKFQREDWRSAVNFVVNSPRSGKLIIFEYDTIPASFEYYYPCNHGKCIPRQAGLKNIPARVTSDLTDFDELLINSREIVYLYDYLVEITDPNKLLAKKLEQMGFKLSNTYDFSGVGFVYEYSK